jgi:hypothetical protein
LAAIRVGLKTRLKDEDRILTLENATNKLKIVLHSWFLPLRNARFYDDRADLSGRNLKRTISYSEIESVVKSGRLRWVEVKIGQGVRTRH